MEISEIKTQLRDFITRELLNRSDYQLADDDALITGGLIDSFSLAQIGVFVEDAFGVYIPDTDLTVEQMDTLEQMAQKVIERNK